MTIDIRLLGRPLIETEGRESYRFRSRKSWGILAYLLLSDRPVPRSRIASLLFERADDPLRALRWNLSEIRRAVGQDATLEGDPIHMQLSSGAVIDARDVEAGIAPDRLGETLLDGMSFPDSPTFELWLLAQRRRLQAASESILHDLASTALARGDHRRAIDTAIRLVTLNPLDEANQATLIRAYRLAGDLDAAHEQYLACVRLFDHELGIAPGPTIEAAIRHTTTTETAPIDDVSVAATIEAGAAAVAAGATESGVQSLRKALALADGNGSSSLRVDARLKLGEALIHSRRGDDEEGAALMTEAIAIAQPSGLSEPASRALSTLGYVDFLAGRYDRAEQRLRRAMSTGLSESVAIRAETYLGSIRSDRGDYPQALERLTDAADRAAAADHPRVEAYARSMLGRVHLLRGDADEAEAELQRARDLATTDHWLSFVPWPEALLGELSVRTGDVGAARQVLRHAFAAACQLGDPCWEGLSARGLALLTEAEGDVDGAFRTLEDARVRCNRLSDTYRWLDAYILDAMCELGFRHGDERRRDWVEELDRIASGAGMGELSVRALIHRADGGDDGALAAARIAAEDIDNPQVSALLDARAV